MKSIRKKEEAKSFSIALFGISNGHREILKRITAITQCRPRQYHLIDDYRAFPDADIIMLNVENVDAVKHWKTLIKQRKNPLATPVIKIYSKANKENSNLGYVLHTPFNPSRLIKLLDKYTIKELDYIPELKIGGAPNENIGKNAVHSLSEYINENKQLTPKKNVLVVDDSDVIRHQLGLELKIKNYKAIYATTGEQALTILKENKFDIVFLDIMLPGIDGYTVCKSIKKNPQLKNMPVIMLTSKSSSFDKIKGTLAGCNTYITKPVNHQEFNQVTEKYLVD